MSAPLGQDRAPWLARGWTVLAWGFLLVGIALVAQARIEQPRREVSQDGLRLRLERAVWLHEPMDHGDAVALPDSDGAPAPGQRRLAVVLAVFNPGPASRSFAPTELVLAPEEGDTTWGPRSREGAEPFVLAPGQLVSLSVDFDVKASAGALRLEWRRGTEREALLATRPPPSAALPSRWPRRVDALPPGDAASGAGLYFGRYACVACHGDPASPEDVRVGPSLHAFVRVGAARVAGLDAAQYAYESLLDPGAFIAPECAGGPCARPSTMPGYGDVLSRQQMADLVRFLVEGRR